MIVKKDIDQLFNNVQHLINHKREIERLKGETFNVFSILDMEKLETKTHSKFIAELLSPKGSHLKGNMFLKLFLQVIGNNVFDAESSTLIIERYIGKVNIPNKTGGIIDIFLYDNNGNYITIENKIDAGDQNSQIERYCNYNKGKNKVYYLTLYGKLPNKSSHGDLKDGEDFYTISYQNDILKWLDLCIKESAGDPILRESIKQYAILIKKITHTMDNKEQDELICLILKHYEESSFIASNFERAKNKITEEIRQDVFNLLVQKTQEN